MNTFTIFNTILLMVLWACSQQPSQSSSRSPGVGADGTGTSGTLSTGADGGTSTSPQVGNSNSPADPSHMDTEQQDYSGDPSYQDNGMNSDLTIAQQPALPPVPPTPTASASVPTTATSLPAVPLTLAQYLAANPALLLPPPSSTSTNSRIDTMNASDPAMPDLDAYLQAHCAGVYSSDTGTCYASAEQMNCLTQAGNYVYAGPGQCLPQLQSMTFTNMQTVGYLPTTMQMLGSTGTQNIYFTTPQVIPEGYYPLASSIFLAAQPPTSYSITIVSGDAGYVRPPASYQLVAEVSLNKSSSLQPVPVSVWMPVPQSGDVCLGLVISTQFDTIVTSAPIQPSMDAIRCINSSYVQANDSGTLQKVSGASVELIITSSATSSVTGLATCSTSGTTSCTTSATLTASHTVTSSGLTVAVAPTLATPQTNLFYYRPDFNGIFIISSSPFDTPLWILNPNLVLSPTME